MNETKKKIELEHELIAFILCTLVSAITTIYILMNLTFTWDIIGSAVLIGCITVGFIVKVSYSYRSWKAVTTPLKG